MLGSLGLLAAAPPLARSQETQGVVAAAESRAAGAATAVVPMTLELAPGAQLATLQFRVTVEPRNGAPVLSPGGALSFAPSTGQPLVLPEGPSTVLVGWLDDFSPTLTGRVEIGFLSVPIPPGAGIGHTYELDVRFPSATSDGETEMALADRDGKVVVAGCGDGFVDPGEECDDSNASNGDCCSASCQFELLGAGCSGDGNVCTNDLCDGVGACAHPPNMVPCDDGTFCNGADRCSAGSCSVHPGDPCPGPDGDGECAESCDEANDSCTAADPLGAACDDGSFCNGNDSCRDGVCAVHVGDPCPGPNGDGNCAESCNEATDGCTAPDPDGSSCDDRQFCTEPDSCVSGVCRGSERSCNDALGCTADRCDEATDQCVHTADHATCDDGNPCTADTCGADGSCAHAAVPDDERVTCDNGNSCRPDSCRAGMCTDGSDCADGCRSAADGTECDDSNDCTDDDVCGGGSCVGATEACKVELPCASDVTGCAVLLPLGVAGAPAQLTVDVRIEGRRGARCRAELFEVAGALRLLTNDANTQVAPRRPRRLAVAKGRIRADGQLVLRLRLNRIGGILLRRAGGRLPANAQVTIREPRPGRTRLLERLITLVQRG